MLSARTMGRIGVAVSLLWLSGCAQIPLGEPAPNFETIEKVRTTGTAPVAVGAFTLAQGVSPDIDKGLSIRSNTASSPVAGSFAQYLKQILIADMQAAGLYDAAATSSLSGALTVSTLDAPIGTGHASLGAHFVLVKEGKAVFEKTLTTETSWPSPFLGVEAIPTGINHYTSLYHQLVGKLLTDPDYRAVNPK